VANWIGPAGVGGALSTALCGCLGQEAPLFILHPDDVVETSITDMVQKRRTGKTMVGYDPVDPAAIVLSQAGDESEGRSDLTLAGLDGFDVEVDPGTSADDVGTNGTVMSFCTPRRSNSRPISSRLRIRTQNPKIQASNTVEMATRTRDLSRESDTPLTKRGTCNTLDMYRTSCVKRLIGAPSSIPLCLPRRCGIEDLFSRLSIEVTFLPIENIGRINQERENQAQ